MRKTAPALIVLALCALLSAAGAHGSDHADPAMLTELEGGITGLFVFSEGDQMIVILNVRRRLVTNPPYELHPFEFAIHMDLHSRISFADPEDRLRYGGTVVSAEGIKENVKIRIRLDDEDPSKHEWWVEGLEKSRLELWTGVRDDPFIFPPFFGSNVISMVVKIPFSEFPEAQQDWVIWGSTTRIDSGEQVDHVGRSNRTQNARFGFLNSLHPKDHLEAIQKRRAKIDKLADFLNRYEETAPAVNLVKLLFSIRRYDLQPDVLIYSKRRPEGFPNGRRLEDDVADLTCRRGDCVLWELSFYDNWDEWPRARENDKPFLAGWPYLAEPWGEREPPQRKSLKTIFSILLVLLLILLLVWFELWRRKKARESIPYVPARRQVT